MLSRGCLSATDQTAQFTLLFKHQLFRASDDSHQHWKQENPSQFTTSTGHEAFPFTLVLNLQNKGRWGSWSSSPCLGLFMVIP